MSCKCNGQCGNQTPINGQIDEYIKQILIRMDKNNINPNELIFIKKIINKLESETISEDPKEYFLIEYLRDKKNKRRGILYAIKISDSTYGIGVSLCSPNDTFNKKLGIEIAKGRATSRGNYYRIGLNDLPQFIEFTRRCSKYFQNLKTPYEILIRKSKTNDCYIICNN